MTLIFSKALVPLLALLILFVGDTKSSRWKDPCNLTLFKKSGNDKYHHVRTIPGNCSKGDLDWHYPEGLILIDFSRPNATRTFKLCLSSSLGNDFKRITDVTAEKEHRDLNWHKRNGTEAICVKSRGRSLKLEAQGPPAMETYMDKISYTITEGEKISVEFDVNNVGVTHYFDSNPENGAIRVATFSIALLSVVLQFFV